MKRVAITACCLAALVAATVWNVRCAIADLSARRNQPEATRLAMRLMANNPAYPAQLADELYASNPEAAKSLLLRAVKLNRYDASSWIQLALLAEAGNDLPRAEQALAQAASVDSTFLPSWSLANFYYRHENAGRFWYWAQKAAQMAPDDATPLFRLAWYTSPSAAEIENRLQLKRPAIEAQFVSFLMTQNDPRAVAEAASRLLGAHGKESTDTVLRVCDWLIDRKRADLALPLWNGLVSSISYSPLEVGSPVTNGSFGKSPLSHGFDWHLMPVAGLSSFLNVRPNALGFEFSGDEPDNFILMTQTAPVRAEQKYVLTIAYGTSGIAPASGVQWVVTDERAGAELARTASLSAEPGGTVQACFATPQRTAFIHLALVYRRQPGTVRVEGKLALQAVRLTAGDCPEQKISRSGAASPSF